jgi:hypothetical protein
MPLLQTALDREVRNRTMEALGDDRCRIAPAVISPYHPNDQWTDHAER